MRKSIRKLTYFMWLLGLLAGLVACAPDFQTDANTYKTYLDEEVRNHSHGYYRAYWQLADSARWAATMAKADTIIAEEQSGVLKIRSERIWYSVKESPSGLRSREHYPGFERVFDSLDWSVNLLVSDRNIARVRIPAADVVLNGDSVRIAIVHAEGPAYDWNFREYVPQPDRLLLTTWGKDTLPIATDMESIGPISRKTVFRIGKYYYLLRYVTPEYDGLIIEALEDARQLPLTAELDLNYKQIPVKSIAGDATTIKRTPGRELFVYFWGGWNGEEQLLRADSLYKALPAERRATLDLAVIARNNPPELLETFVDKHDIALPIYLGTEKTCLRLNCTPYLPSVLRVNGRGRIVSFHDWPKVLEDRLTELAK